MWVTPFKAGPWQYVIATMDKVAWTDIVCTIESKEDAQYLEIAIPEGERARKYNAQFGDESELSFVSKGITSDEKYRYEYGFGYPSVPFYVFLELSVDWYTLSGGVLRITAMLNEYLPVGSSSVSVPVSFTVSNGSTGNGTITIPSGDNYGQIEVGGGQRSRHYKIVQPVYRRQYRHLHETALLTRIS